LKILFFLHLPNPYPGAAWARISFFAKYLMERDHQVSIAGAFTPSTIMKAGIRKVNGIKLLNITPLIITANFASLLCNVISMLTTIPTIIILRPDIIVISVPNGQAAVGPFVISKLFKKKIVFDIRDEWEDHLIEIAKSRIDKNAFKLFKLLIGKCYQRSDKVFAVTERHQQKLFERNIKDVELISNGADCKIFRPYTIEKEKTRNSLGFDKDDFVIIYSGGIGGYYRVYLILNALKKVNLKLPKIKLLIVGYGLGSDIKAMDNLIDELGLQNNVKYRGTEFDKTELAKLISCCDIGIVPYDGNPLWKNSLPVKSFEYFACGLPIIATAYNDSILGIIVEKNNIGIVSKPECVECLATSIEKIYQSDIDAAGNRAISLMKTTYDRNIIAKKFLGLLESL
jgi:glycosyltransferase involved in cell wall biosynthesis